LKDSNDKDLLARTIGLGVMSGIRSMAGPATIANWATRYPKKLRGTIFSLLTDRFVARLVSLSLLGEMVLDKLPVLPDRVARLPLLGRAFWGGAAGAVAYKGTGRSSLEGAGIAALAAIVSTQVTYRLRVGLKGLLRLPDLLIALAEDALVFYLARRITKM
jgi:uncharacterized membrane protein